MGALADPFALTGRSHGGWPSNASHDLVGRSYNAAMPDFDAPKLTWAVLLGRWVEFARSAVALPDDAEGRAWRAAVPDVVGLQAVAMALRDAERLERDQLALGVDRARVLIERHTANLHQAFDTSELHPMLVELITDAWSAVKAAERAIMPASPAKGTTHDDRDDRDGQGHDSA
jgi:hypothetical protein